MFTGLLLASPLLLFFGKMFLFGFLGCLLLGLIQMALDIKMNPNGWKFGKEFYRDEDEDIMRFAQNGFADGITDDDDSDDDDKNGHPKLRLQRVRVHSK